MGPIFAHLASFVPRIPRDRHDRRVAELISVVWLLALADLFFTLWAHFFTPFHELNPVARYLLAQNLIPSLILYKLIVTAIGTTIFWRLRHYRRAEVALWGIAAAYVLLAVRWSDYTSTTLALGAFNS